MPTDNRMSQPISNMNSMRINDMSSYNIAAESPSNLHNCLFNKDVRFRPNNIYYSSNIGAQMGNFNSSVFLAIRPMSYGSLAPNSNMGNFIYNGDNKLILKTSPPQHMIQIPLSQLIHGQQQVQQNPYYQLSRNNYYGPH